MSQLGQSWRERWQRVRSARREVVGINRRNLELVYPHNPRRHYPIADDKLLAKELLRRAGVAVPETLAVCDGLYAVPKVLHSLTTRDNFVVKPANGSGGAGILVVKERCGDGQWEGPSGTHIHAAQLRRHLADVVFGAFSKDMEDRAFVEPRIVPHPLFSDLWADGLCDIRIITLHGAPLMSMVRVPTRRSLGRANLHQGGLGLAIDLATGKTFRAVSQGKSLERHPESGEPLLGLEIPHWSDVLAVAERAGSATPLAYLGIDVVIDRVQGPLVLEINARPGLEIQNVNGQGLAPAVVRALRRDAAARGVIA